MGARQKWDGAVRHVKRYGVRRTAVYALFTAAWRVRAGRLGLLMRLDPSVPVPNDVPAGITIRSLTPAEALRFADDANPRFSPAVLRTCLARGDRCIAAFDGGRLVGAKWFATSAVRQLGAWWWPVAPAVIGHLAWVDPAVRGRRIGGAVTAGFRRENRGVPILAVVEVGNFAERRSMKRSGYRCVGLLAQFGPEQWNAGVAVQRNQLIRSGVLPVPPTASSRGVR
jgi:hypothetical protein